jgi:hypothetical protein
MTMTSTPQAPGNTGARHRDGFRSATRTDNTRWYVPMVQGTSVRPVARDVPGG